MSIQRLRIVYIQPDIWNSQFSALANQAQRCITRRIKAAPGDRLEAQKFTALCGQMEVLAADLIEGGHPWVLLTSPDANLYLSEIEAPLIPWQHTLASRLTKLLPSLSSLLGHLAQGGVVFHINDPFGEGLPALTPTRENQALPPSEIWRSSENSTGLAAVSERWMQQLQYSVNSDQPLIPSGVSNRVMAEGLRKFVQRRQLSHAVMARVVYRDGSEARPFPLGTLALHDSLPADRRVLRVALISIRHPEMDTEVDAAWLRNRTISQVRAAAETDAIAYELSCQQLKQIADSGLWIIWMYQTGFEPAVMGFYRALAEHLATHASPVAVWPRYFSRKYGFQEGAPWVKVP
jgi:hypothetical protein